MSLTSSPPALDPPFRGYIETTFDALLVFEAARRGMIPRVTRRLIERERGMVQSGAVFVFDEHESGIKRWTDGLVWSPSRILGNFLVYRETEKRSNQPPTPISSGHNTSPIQSSPSIDQNSRLEEPSAFGHGALPRPRSASDGGSNLDRQRERQLVGSLVNSSKFKDRGLVKKTMSVTVNGFAQHMISYYTMEDVMSGRLRSPSSIPELASLEISPEYLHKQNFRFPPMIEVGADGIPRYRWVFFSENQDSDFDSP
ncbi:Gti1/Pac2 family-domain-containing protein [Kockovaella imperatae]|uniref:Gti1/Pac2 family-domain-containing protein n=1 Tax=Kockovaella imperatae TaxID=4999 RepID=A0A1Y1UAH2_9TREE|nr:Gti1/Pac2 family-domain-containing protein [Kockovaella imperatae]ORX34544.1 Gti1/Pac2 family-domain-containing protein [Kockovaella imperatae]